MKAFVAWLLGGWYFSHIPLDCMIVSFFLHAFIDTPQHTGRGGERIHSSSQKNPSRMPGSAGRRPLKSMALTSRTTGWPNPSCNGELLTEAERLVTYAVIPDSTRLDMAKLGFKIVSMS